MNGIVDVVDQMSNSVNAKFQADLTQELLISDSY